MRHRGTRRWQAAVLSCAATMVLAPAMASAGEDPQAPKAPATKVVVERVENGPVFGPDVKYTRVDGRDGLLIGAHGGVLFERTLLLGGAGYWLANGDHSLGMTYGGFLVEWYALRSSRIALSLGGLIGGGFATVSGGSVYPVPGDQASFGRHGHGGWSDMPYYPGHVVYYDQGFFIAEPQVNVVWQAAPGVAIVGGAGYRLIGAAYGLEDQIRGVTGTVSIRFGGGR